MGGITVNQLKVFVADIIAVTYPHCTTWLRLVIIGVTTTVYTAGNAYYKTRVHNVPANAAPVVTSTPDPLIPGQTPESNVTQ